MAAATHASGAQQGLEQPPPAPDVPEVEAPRTRLRAAQVMCLVRSSYMLACTAATCG